jgi:hypothetical protein
MKFISIIHTYTQLLHTQFLTELVTMIQKRYKKKRK